MSCFFDLEHVSGITHCISCQLHKWDWVTSVKAICATSMCTYMCVNIWPVLVFLKTHQPPFLHGKQIEGQPTFVAVMVTHHNMLVFVFHYTFTVTSYSLALLCLTFHDMRLLLWNKMIYLGKKFRIMLRNLNAEFHNEKKLPVCMVIWKNRNDMNLMSCIDVCTAA